jgi:diadenylate cyclase
MSIAALNTLCSRVEKIDLPLGLGSRHLAAASISQRLGAVAIVVSESGVVRVFHRGEIEATLIPELWLLDRHRAQLGGRASRSSLAASRTSGETTNWQTREV